LSWIIYLRRVRKEFASIGGFEDHDLSLGTLPECRWVAGGKGAMGVHSVQDQMTVGRNGHGAKKKREVVAALRVGKVACQLPHSKVVMWLL